MRAKMMKLTHAFRDMHFYETERDEQKYKYFMRCTKTGEVVFRAKTICDMIEILDEAKQRKLERSMLGLAYEKAKQARLEQNRNERKNGSLLHGILKLKNSHLASKMILEAYKSNNTLLETIDILEKEKIIKYTLVGKVGNEEKAVYLDEKKRYIIDNTIERIQFKQIGRLLKHEKLNYEKLYQ